MPIEELNIADIAQNVVDDPSAAAEATRPRTVPTGGYRLHFRDVTGQQPDTGGAPYLRFTADVLDPHSGERRGTVYFNATWVSERDDRGQLRGDFKRFVSLAKATQAELNVSAVIEGFRNADVSAFITETIKTPEGEYMTVGGRGSRTVAPADVPDLLLAGATIANYVQNISALK